MAKQNEQKKMFFNFFCCSLADAVCSPRIMQFIFFSFIFNMFFFHILLLPHIDLDIILSWANFYIIFLELYLCMCIVEKSAHTYTLIMWIHNFLFIFFLDTRIKKLWIIFFSAPLSSLFLPIAYVANLVLKKVYTLSNYMQIDIKQLCFFYYFFRK